MRGIPASSALVIALFLAGCSSQSQIEAGGTPRGQEAPQSAAPPAPGRYVTGIVFEDRNGNGIYDTGDVRMADQRVLLTDASGRQRGSAATGPEGAFRFEGLERGGYRVTVHPPDGFVPVNDATVEIEVPEDGSPADVQFGLRPGTAER